MSTSHRFSTKARLVAELIVRDLDLSAASNIIWVATSGRQTQEVVGDKVAKRQQDQYLGKVGWEP